MMKVSIDRHALRFSMIWLSNNYALFQTKWIPEYVATNWFSDGTNQLLGDQNKY